MRKEVLLAILAGISIGLIFAIGSWKITKIIKRNKPIIEVKETAKPNNFLILLDQIKNLEVAIENPLPFKGTTRANSSIIISTEEKDYYVKSDSEGIFETNINLLQGLNNINIMALNKNEKVDSKINLVFSEEFIKYLKDNNLEKSKSVYYVGTITDISSNTIQLKNDEQKIVQLLINEDCSFHNSIKQIKGIKLSDLAIGDYIIAMGFENGNKVLKTGRILITNPQKESKYEIKMITIETLSKTKINDTTLPKKWNGPNTKEMEIGQNIILVGLQNNDKFDIRSIFTVE